MGVKQFEYWHAFHQRKTVLAVFAAIIFQMTSIENSRFENISPTAWTIAHRRTFTDIPYSQAIFDEIEKIRTTEVNKEIPEILKSPQMAPQIEARYKLVLQLLRENKVTQILEIAAGLSPRGLQTTDDPLIQYVELDLPGIMNQKKHIVETIGKRDNLHLEVGNALDLESLRKSIIHFDTKLPLGIVHEGLLRYLNFEEKKIVAHNIHSLLTKFGGVWITPDITLRSVIAAENMQAKNRVYEVGKLIGVNINNNAFENVDSAIDFFEHLGFSVELHSFLEVIDKLSSPKKLGRSIQQVKSIIEGAYVFVMRLQPNI